MSKDERGVMGGEKTPKLRLQITRKGAVAVYFSNYDIMVVNDVLESCLLKCDRIVIKFIDLLQSLNPH